MSGDFLSKLQRESIEEWSRERLEGLSNEKLAEYLKDGCIDGVVIRSKYGSKIWRATIINLTSKRHIQLTADNGFRNAKSKMLINNMRRVVDNCKKNNDLIEKCQ